MKQADDLFASLKESGLENGADTIIARYKLLADYIKAKDAKDEIDENDYASYAQSNYDRGCDNLKVVEYDEKLNEFRKTYNDLEDGKASQRVINNLILSQN